MSEVSVKSVVVPSLCCSGYNSEESDEMIPSPSSYMSYSPGAPAEYYAAPSPPDFLQHAAGLQHHSVVNAGPDEWFEPQNQNQDWGVNGSAFFWAQLQKEENQLREICDSALLAPDAQGKT